MPSCSKAPRGLFVQSRVQRIFTLSAISPGPSLRQCPDRDTIRAGRNLPDKEFRYLRTVIVTAAVHRGFGSSLAALPLTFRHWAGVSPHTAPYGLAETCVFVKQSPGPVPCARPEPTPQPGSLLPKLRDQFAEFLNEGSPDRLTVLTAAHQCRFAVRAARTLQHALFLALPPKRLTPVTRHLGSSSLAAQPRGNSNATPFAQSDVLHAFTGSGPVREY